MIGKDSWTWQMSQKYPQHQYRNYSEGGRGLEYFEWCMQDAKRWGADTVFLNRSYSGRWAFLLDAKNDHDFDSKSYFKDLFDFHTEPYGENWEEANLTVPYLWGNISGRVEVSSGCHTSKEVTGLIKMGQDLYKNYYSTYARRAYEDIWYTNILSNQLFDNLFVLHWSPEHNIWSKGPVPKTTVTTNIGFETVIDFLKVYAGVNDEHELVEHGIEKSKDDNHLTFKGNKILLEEYILSQEDVIKALT